MNHEPGDLPNGLEVFLRRGGLERYIYWGAPIHKVGVFCCLKSFFIEETIH